MALKLLPNFVVLFLDDTGWGDIGVNWNTTASPGETPHIDSLATDGLRFTDFHAGASVCTPSRAALLTGRLGARTGVIHNFDPASLFGLPQQEITIAELLKPQGYATKMIGKWHLGVRPGFHPSYRGFDEVIRNGVLRFCVQFSESNS